MNNKSLEMIVAATACGEIGYQNTLPWRLKGDLRRFKEITMGNIIVMGKNTYESLPSPLEGRTVIVVSSSLYKLNSQVGQDAKGNPVFFARSLVEALKFAKDMEGEKILIAGGVQLYAAALKMPIILHLTLVHKDSANGYDAVIPDFNLSEFNLIETHMPPNFATVGLSSTQGVYDIDPVTNIPVPSHTYLTYRSKNHPQNF